MTEGRKWGAVAGGQRARCERDQGREGKGWQRPHIRGSRLQAADGSSRWRYFKLFARQDNEGVEHRPKTQMGPLRARSG